MYYLVSLLYGASTSFIAPIYVVFLLNRGLDYKGVALLYSGAFTAWLVDSLKEENRDRDLSVVFGNAEVLSLIVSSTGSLIGD